MTDISGFDFNGGATSGKVTNDVAFAKFLVEKVGVAVVPGSSFYGNPADGASQVRFTFCKKESTLAAAEERLAQLPQHLAPTERGSRPGQSLGDTPPSVALLLLVSCKFDITSAVNRWHYL